MNDSREEEINTCPLEADGNQEASDFTPPHLWYKSCLNSDSGKVVFGHKCTIFSVW